MRLKNRTTPARDKSAVQNLEETFVSLGKNIAKQKEDNLKLQKLIQDAPNEQKNIREEITTLKEAFVVRDFDNLSIGQFGDNLAKIQSELQQVQSDLISSMHS